jgi:hypothetical protein
VTLAVDFDNTLAYSPEYPKVGQPLKDVLSKVKKCKKAGDKVILHTARSGRDLKLALEWCAKKGLEFDEVVVKPRADIYIDDRSIRPEEF